MQTPIPSGPPITLLPVSELPPLVLPRIIERAGQTTVFAAEEIFYGNIRNPQRRTTYLHNVK